MIQWTFYGNEGGGEGRRKTKGEKINLGQTNVRKRPKICILTKNLYRNTLQTGYTEWEDKGKEITERKYSVERKNKN